MSLKVHPLVKELAKSNKSSELDGDKVNNKLLEFKKHEYDIDIVEIYKRVCSVIDNTRQHNFFPHVTHQRFIKTQLDYINYYCAEENISFELTPIIVVSSTNTHYLNFLALSLAFYDIPKIELFLDAQKTKYFGKEDFVSFVEFAVYGYINRLNPFDNTLRLEKVTQWIKKNKLIPAPSQLQPLPQKEKDPLFLDWIDGIQSLKAISFQLQLAGYTKKKNDFKNVFEKKIPIHWLKEPEFLVYLLDKLYKASPKFYKASRSKAYLGVAQHFFCKDSQILAKKNQFSLLRNKVINPNHNHYKALRTRADSLIEQIKLKSIPARIS